MKKILFVFGVLLSTIAFSQVEDGTLSIRFQETYEYNQYTDKYEEIGRNWVDIKFYFSEDYYIIYSDDTDPVKVFWEHDSNDENSSTYVLEDGRVFIFDFDTQELFFFWDWNKTLSHHEKYVIWGKTSFKADN